MIIAGELDKLTRDNVIVQTLLHSNLTENIDNKIIFSTNIAKDLKDVYSIPLGISSFKPDIIKNKINEDKNIRNLMYMNHHKWTDAPNYDRSLLYRKFNYGWVTKERRKTFEEYIDAIYNHKFIICPIGGGIDTFRKWEALYLGTIPIVKREFNDIFYEDLPILYVDSWDEITEEHLNEQYNIIKNKVWNLDKLNFKYWEEKIKD